MIHQTHTHTHTQDTNEQKHNKNIKYDSAAARSGHRHHSRYLGVSSDQITYPTRCTRTTIIQIKRLVIIVLNIVRVSRLICVDLRTAYAQSCRVFSNANLQLWLWRCTVETWFTRLLPRPKLFVARSRRRVVEFFLNFSKKCYI